MATKQTNVTGNITAGTLTSDQYLVTKAQPVEVNVRGVFVGNVRLRASYDNGVTFDDVYVFTGPDTVRLADVAGTPLLVLDASAGGDWTSGSAAIFIGN